MCGLISHRSQIDRHPDQRTCDNRFKPSASHHLRRTAFATSSKRGVSDATFGDIACAQSPMQTNFPRSASQSKKLWSGRPAFVSEWREQIDRNWKKCRRVMFAGNLAHGLEEA